MRLVVDARERELLFDHTLIDGELRTRLATADEAGTGKLAIHLRPDELLEWIALAANHEEERSLESRLDGLYDRLQRVEGSLDVYES